MILRHLSILNYKNISEASLDFSSKLNCFIGHNGEGKTNLLDAVYYLSFCKSAFSSTDSTNIRHGEPFFMIEGDYENEQGEKENIYCGMKVGSKKHFRRNKKEYKRYSQHIGMIPLIMLSPYDSYLIEGSGEERRKMMDVAISQYDNSYIEALNNYNKALQQRNVLLKMEDNCDLELIKLWEEQMAEYGMTVSAKRSLFIERLVPLFQEYYSKISADKEQVSLHYKSHTQRGNLLEVIQRDRHKDLAVGYSLHGIHRDDLEMQLGNYAMRREGSQGQNKTFVISLKLAQHSLLCNNGAGTMFASTVGAGCTSACQKTKPILLLDDIFDKLDAERVERIVNLVSTDDFGQIFITDTNRSHLDKILQKDNFNHKTFVVENGKITHLQNLCD